LTFAGNIRLTNGDSVSSGPSIATSGIKVHVVWKDNRDGNFEVYYKLNPSGNPIGIINISSEIPKDYKLNQNYPNPFNPSTNIRFGLSKSSNVKLSVYDILGNEVTVLVNNRLNPGTFEVHWDASNFASGVYFYKLQTDGFAETKKMLMVK
jgi:hypothetical protein